MFLGSVWPLMSHQEHLLLTRLLAVNADLFKSCLTTSTVTMLQAPGTIPLNIKTQVILAFWLVLAYDLLEDRCPIDTAKRCLRHYFKLIWESPTTENTNFHRHCNAPFRSKLESNGLQVDHNRKFSERFFQLLQYSRQHPSFSAHWADLMTKPDSTFPAFPVRIVYFEVQFFLRCKFSFHEKRHSSQVWQWRYLPKPITIFCQRLATNGIASFCLDHKWRQMAFFAFVKMGKASLSRALREINSFYANKVCFFII